MFALRLLLLLAMGLASGKSLLTWEEFKRVFHKSYVNEEFELMHRSHFHENERYISRRNAEQNSFTLGINHLADLNEEQYRSFLSLHIPSRQRNPAFLNRTASESIDWRTQNAVSEVKNQGQCGSCWAFATVGSVEGHYAIATGSLRSLSEQQLVDCTTSNKGCLGGNIDLAFRYIINNHGIDDEGDYPYVGDGSSCDADRSTRIAARIQSYADVPPNSEEEMLKAISLGPVAVAIEADQKDFQLYKSGVFDAPCGSKLDHGVLVVGFSQDYFIVKNSWGSTWGNQGYIYLKRGMPSPAGQCGILSAACYPIVTDDKPIPIPPPSPEPSYKCGCGAICENMCKQFGMACCSGKGGNCNCQPMRPDCCDSKQDIMSFLI